jgi:outer membrane receptor protein involved in Fe transport
VIFIFALLIQWFPNLPSQLRQRYDKQHIQRLLSPNFFVDNRTTFVTFGIPHCLFFEFYSDSFMRIDSHLGKSIWLFFLLFTGVQSGVGQTVSGTVVNEDNSPLQDVYISNQSNKLHSHTNQHGEFLLQQVSLGDTISFAYLGYKTHKEVISNFDISLNIQLTSQPISISEIIIGPDDDALQLAAEINIQTETVNSTQDLLPKVPGLFIGQHAGGGKAEQIFLRGFDIDHGTDINISVDGLPVNMVSHAHGQGYADLHFVIPETVENIDFGKGPYNADKGNFTTAGFVDLKTKDRLGNSSVKLEAGQFDTQRLLGMFELLNTAKNNVFIASEFLMTNGAFDSPQNFNRINLFGKYSGLVSSTDRVEVSTSYFTSKWTASGQIPIRSVENNSIGRFGAIDDTEGGNTSRKNICLNYEKQLNPHSSIKNSLFVSQYDFELFSNFTFYLEDSINGDQIKQKESRILYGLNTEYERSFSKNDTYGKWKLGISYRADQSKDNELSRTLNRSETLEQIKFGDIYETNLGTYSSLLISRDKWSFEPSVRFDYFDFQYVDHLNTAFENQAETQSIVSPKLNISYHQSETLQLYVKTGKGFHSNDTRVVIANQGFKTLPGAYGFDAGTIWKPTKSMLINVAYWYLFLEQEFVYVGDAGVVEPSGKTKRNGVEFSWRYQPASWIFWSLDANYTIARSMEDPEGENYIPLAPDFTLVSGLTIVHPSGMYGGLKVRHLDNRPANEDNSIIAEGYTVTDLNLGYNWKSLSLGIQIQNLFNTEWNETQFATLSRLKDEIDPVEEIHFTPGTPFFLKTIIQFKF